jgi:ABC-2 type transport system permease protein
MMLPIHMFAALIKKELLALSRDIHGMAALFLMPMVFIIVMSMALRDVYSPPVKNLSYAVFNQDQGQQAKKLAERWAVDHGQALALPDNWQDEVRAGHLKYVLLIENGFSTIMDKPNSKITAKARLITDPGLNNNVFETNRMHLVAMVSKLRAEGFISQLPKELGASALAGDAPVEAERMKSGPRATAVQQNVPAWLIFGMFFVVASIAGLFVEERSCGALTRLRSLGAKPWQLITSKIIPYLLVNGVQAVLMLVVGIWLMPLIGGEGLSLAGVNWPALLLMLFSISLAAVSLALTVACLVNTHAQASTLGPILNVLMAALGGVMVPLFVMPPVMQKIAAYSPMNWGLEGLLDVLLRNGDISSVMPEAGRLAGFSALMLVFAFLLFRRRV